MCHPTELANTLQLSAITECGFRKADQRGGYICRAYTFTQDVICTGLGQKGNKKMLPQ